MATLVARRRRSIAPLATALCSVFLVACTGGSTTSAPDVVSPTTGATPESSAGSTTPSPTDPASPPDTTPTPHPSGPVAATDVVLGLAWQPNADPIAGYIVYYGPSAATAVTLATQLSSSNSAFAQAPSVSFNAGRDLGLNYGDSVCFRLRAYNAMNALSDWSQAACANI